MIDFLSRKTQWLRLHQAKIGQLALTIFAAGALADSWALAWFHYNSRVWFDFWLWADDLQLWATGHYSILDLIRPHYGEHRIATTRLVLLIYALVFNMNGRFVAICALGALLSAGLALGTLIRRGIPTNSPAYVPPLLFAGFMSGICQSENLTLPFQIQFPIIVCLAVACFWAFASATTPHLTERASLARAALGFCAFLLAVFSMSSGLLLLPAICILLWLRHARTPIWIIYAMSAASGLALEVPRHLAVFTAANSAAPLLRQLTFTQLWGLRAHFSANFLGSAFHGWPEFATFAGATGFALIAYFLLRATLQRLRGWPLIAHADATLLGLGLFCAFCGPAGSLTLRIVFGPDAALASRYATMSLLFWTALAGLVLRTFAQRRPTTITRLAIAASAVFFLASINLNRYRTTTIGINRSITAECALLANNIGLEGPMPVIFADGIPAIRQQARFLHNAKMNFFAPDQGPPPALLARLEAAPIGSLPLCHGWLDQATAIDDGAFLLNGWLTDPQTRHTADYIAIRDRTGKILATAPALEERIDLIAPLGIKPPSLGFIAGARDNSADTHFVRLAGLFPGKTRELCEWPTLVTINGLQLQPLEELHNPHAGPASTFSFANGFHADAGRLNSTPQISASLQVASSDGGTPQQPHRLVITLDLTKPSTEALALPVLASGIARQKSADFIMRDGTDLRISLDPWWNWKGWHSVVLPLAVRQSHGDVARIEITDAGEGAITIGAPMLAAANPGWSKLF